MDKKSKQKSIIAKYYKKKSNISNYYKKKALLKKEIKVYKDLEKEDVIYKIINNLISRLLKLFDKQKYADDITHMQLIGCTAKELRYHLKSLFKDGMTFDNYGEWEVDHIYPISLTDMTNLDEVKQCCNYKNLQPLWMSDNRSKSNKIM